MNDYDFKCNFKLMDYSFGQVLYFVVINIVVKFGFVIKLKIILNIVRSVGNIICDFIEICCECGVEIVCIMCFLENVVCGILDFDEYWDG